MKVKALDFAFAVDDRGGSELLHIGHHFPLLGNRGLFRRS